MSAGGLDMDTLEVCEIFRSLQGETRWSGLPTTFLRLSGCNLRCRFCDTAYAYEAGLTRPLPDLLREVLASKPGDLVSITGGEPLLQPAVLPLMTALADAGRTVVLETNGSLDIGPVDPRVYRVVDVKGPGSGEQDANRWENLEGLRVTDEVKFVVGDRADFDFAAGVITRYDLAARCGVLLSPVADVLPPTDLARWILEDGRSLRLQIQLHRHLWPDTPRGV